MASDEGGVEGTNHEWRGHGGPPAEASEAQWWPDGTLGERFRRWTTPPAGMRNKQSLVPAFLVERLGANGIDAVGTAPKRSMPPVTAPSVRKRVSAMVQRMASHGPQGDAPEQAALLRVGEEALSVLCAEFPGRLWFSRWQPHKRPPRGRDLSALCRTLVAFGERAVPYVAELLESMDPNTRYYAALVALDLSHPAFVPCLARLLFDPDEGTAKVALQMLASFRQFEGCEELLGGLRAAATLAETDERSRLLAIRALAVVRDEAAVQPLIALVSGHGVLSEAAWRVLRMLSLQDFGQDQARWQSWYAQHGREPRLRWLGRGLEHQDPTIREIARRDLVMQQSQGQSRS